MQWVWRNTTNLIKSICCLFHLMNPLTKKDIGRWTIEDHGTGGLHLIQEDGYVFVHTLCTPVTKIT